MSAWHCELQAQRTNRRKPTDEPRLGVAHQWDRPQGTHGTIAGDPTEAVQGDGIRGLGMSDSFSPPAISSKTIRFRLTIRRCLIETTPGTVPNTSTTDGKKPPTAPQPVKAQDVDVANRGDEATVLRLPPGRRLGPDHRDLYVLIIGLVLGLLAGPWVLGRVMPGLYQRAFVGAVAQQKAYEQHERDITGALETFDAETRALLDNLKKTGVTDIALQEKQNQRDEARQQYEMRQIASGLPLQAQLENAQRRHTLQLAALKLSLMLAVAMLMVLEAMLEPRAVTGLAASRGRLASARYGLVAIWLAMVLAEPTALVSAKLLFVVGLTVIALALVFMPLGWMRRSREA